VEERWQQIKSTVKRAMVRKKFKLRRRRIGFKDWWDRECTNKKIRLQRHYNGGKEG